jgi:hypothetical protein
MISKFMKVFQKAIWRLFKCHCKKLLLVFINWGRDNGKMFVSFKGYQQGCVTKKRGSKITRHTDCLQRTQASMFSWSTPQFRPPIFHSTLIAYWLFQTNITRSKTYKCFASTQQHSRFHSIHLLPRPFT